MKVKSKVILLTIISIVATVSLSSLIVRTVLIKNILTHETVQIDDNYKRAMAIFHKEEASLEGSVSDWAVWDDTYKYIQDGNEEYIDSNMEDDTMKSLKLNFIILIDSNSNIVFSKLYDWNSHGKKTFLIELEKSLKLKDEFKRLLSVTKPVTGTLLVSGKPVFISMSPITTSDGRAPANGILIMGKSINQDFIDYLQKVLRVNIEIEATSSPAFDNIASQDFNKKSFDGAPIFIERNEDEIKGYSVLKDIYGRKEAFLVLKLERENYKQAMIGITYFIIFVLITFSIVGIIFNYFSKKLITNRLNILHTFMEKVTTSLDTTARIYLPGNDEISKLAVNTNIMLEEIDKHYSEIKLMEERFLLIMEATNDGFFDVDLINNEIYISPDWLIYLGYEDSNGYISYERLYEIIYLEDKELFIRSFEECLSGKAEDLRVEYRMKNKSGEWIWVEIKGKIVEYNQYGKPIRLIGTSSNIMKRKKYEEENIYLSQTDVTTTLKNRAYMESMFKKARECKMCNSWIVMGDVNGLKLINDTFGHQEGDRLLHEIGSILKKCCANDIAARWGGDEFIIFIRDNDETYVDNLISSIKKEFNTINEYPVKVSIAFGHAQKEKQNFDMDTVLKTAEERMYRNKLLESRSARSAILASLEQSLHEKSIETEEHTRRIKQIAVLIGVRMGLSQAELDEIALLGSLHDIGKIGIPEAILMKPDKLTREEWEIMKTHTDIGYRIAGATPDLAHIADEILSHHERYDGNGYPQGLKGTAIPKLSRLINIVDSFDVMTHDRLYKKAMSMESVIQEIKDCSGKQFDPEMVEAFLEMLNEGTTISSFTL